MDHRRELINYLVESRQAMRHVVGMAQEEEEIYPPWTMREILAHISGWDDVTIAALSAHARGEVPLTPASRGIDYYNAQTVSTREGLDFDHILREWETTRQLLIELLVDYPLDRMEVSLAYPWGSKGSVAGIIHIMAEHEHEHAAEIQSLLSKQG